MVVDFLRYNWFRLLFLCVFLFATGCTAYYFLVVQPRLYREKEIVAKIKECGAIKPILEKQLDKDDSNSTVRRSFVNEVFYSPKRQSCIVYILTQTSIGDELSFDITLKDYYTNEILFSDYNIKEGFLEKEQELKAVKADLKKSTP
ncbi:MAG: hypothetical protein Q8P11_00225 [bacterium]|nr:hypothetical protein [bacterium]